MEERAEETLNVNPSVQSGWVVRTTDVYEAELKNNAFFTAINNISYNEGKRFLQLDSVKYGTSVVTKTPGVGKGEKVYINPKAHDLTSYGSNYGKLGQTDATGNDIAMADVVFSGSNNQIPTVMGIMIRKNVLDMANAAPKDFSDNSTVPSQTSPLSGEIGAAETISVPSLFGVGLLPFSINPDSGKKIKEKDKTKRGAGGANLRTGTVLNDSDSVKTLAKPLTPFGNNAIFGGN